MSSLLQAYWPALLNGLGVTLLMASIIWTAGIVGGGALGLACTTAPTTLGRLVRILAFLAAAIPALILLYWAHYPAQAIMNVTFDPFVSTCFVLGALNIVLVADIIANAILKLPADLGESCKVAALSERGAFIQVLAPAALRTALPALVAVQLSMLHMTLFGSFISVTELFRTVQQINSLEQKPIELYTILAAIFAAICIPLALLQSRLSHRIGKSL